MEVDPSVDEDDVVGDEGLSVVVSSSLSIKL